jgi:hypothetical protein
MLWYSRGSYGRPLQEGTYYSTNREGLEAMSYECYPILKKEFACMVRGNDHTL